MFTGIIEQLATVTALTAGQLLIENVYHDLKAGESIAVNGVCLTLLPGFANNLTFDLSPETLKLTNLGQLEPTQMVNLERAMPANGRFGGHYVSGHVDTTAYILAVKKMEDCVNLLVGDFQLFAQNYLLPKGSIALNGVSLTINTIEKEGINLMLVPHTLAHTTFGQLTVGARLNVEFDYLTRVVAHQLNLAAQLKNEVK